MKKILLSICYFFTTILFTQAQVLYGTTFKGGANGGGTVNKFTPATNNLTVIKSFETYASTPFYTTLAAASDGKLYGLSTLGGSSDSGIIFSYDPVSSTYKNLKSFDSSTGTIPYGGLIQASDGKLYGTTIQGGSSGAGVIFSFDPVSGIYTKLVDFNYSDGGNPVGNLLQATDGKLYGITTGGGTNFVGVIYSFDPVSLIYSKLVDLDLATGAYGWGSLVQAGDGKLYGLTSQGGSSGNGTIFSYDISTFTYTDVVDFNLSNGGYPTGGMVKGGDGKLYGMTPRGGNTDNGVIFSFDPSAPAFTKLADLNGTDGAYPVSNLLAAADGKLYGMTSEGGSNNLGVVFSFSPAGLIYTKLQDFNITNGSTPYGSLTEAADGKLYGLTRLGGSGGNGGLGVIFSFSYADSVYTKLKNLGTNESGTNISAGLFKAGNGKLYGMTTNGGHNSFGTIFSVDPVTSVYTNLVNFDNANGANPHGSLTQAGDGKLYGTTTNGGYFNIGVIFSYDPATTAYAKLFEFDYANGGYPYTSLVEFSDGKLYGTAARGGGASVAVGVIFSFDPLTATYTKLVDLDYRSQGGFPYNDMIKATDGKLYGMTFSGGVSGYGEGVIFSFEPGTSTFTKLVDFNISNGQFPAGHLVQAKDGKLYGMTQKGGANNYGVIFSFDPATSTFTNLVNFDKTNGAFPLGSLYEASDGKLYGSTQIGGSDNIGVIFSFDPSDSTYTNLKEFNGANGSLPYIGSAFIEVPGCMALVNWYKDADGDGYGNPDSLLKACNKPTGYVTDNTDCNDKAAAIHGPEIYYRDADRDGFGDAGTMISVCNNKPPAGYVKNNYDCNDHKRTNLLWNEKLRMCRNGNSECVALKEVIIRLWQGWTLGPCPVSGDTRLSNPISGNLNKAEMDRKLQLMPGEYKLSNYPNPFSGTSTIKYELPKDSRVSIKVYDALGRSIATLVDENKKAGTYTVDFKAGRFSKGSFYYRVIATSKDDRFEQTNRMILLR